MESKPLQITLLPAPNDLPEMSDEYQAQLRRFDETLQGEGFAPSSIVLVMEAAGSGVAPYLGIFSVAISGSLSALSIALGAWLKGKYGRVVELEIDGAKARAATIIEDVRALMEIAQEFRDRNETKRITP